MKINSNERAFWQVFNRTVDTDRPMRQEIEKVPIVSTTDSSHFSTWMKELAQVEEQRQQHINAVRELYLAGGYDVSGKQLVAAIRGGVAK